MTTIRADVVVMGGGIAGLWTLNRLHAAGYQAVLLENRALGSGQTRYAQGIIHGGTKYALTGKLTASSEALAEMPALWRSCLQGNGEIDLSRAELLSEAHYLWSTRGLASKITGFFASQVMRARTRALAPQERPELFRNRRFKGSIIALDEPVFDTLSVIRAIAEPLMHAILPYDEDSLAAEPGRLRLRDSAGSEHSIEYSKIILTAGPGNGALISSLGLTRPQMQLRPLKMVMLRGGLEHKVFAHCMGAGVNPRVTITTHADGDGQLVWYLGGQLAEDGVHRTDEEQLEFAMRELRKLIPWVELDGTEWATLDIDRAEIRRPGGLRPDSFNAEQHGDVIVAWPTKLALAPLLAQQLLDMVEQSGVDRHQQPLPAVPAVPIAGYPWCEDARWGRI
jgi:glycerol-3-phosphate dehydrogenase